MPTLTAGQVPSPRPSSREETIAPYSEVWHRTILTRQDALVAHTASLRRHAAPTPAPHPDKTPARPSSSKRAAAHPLLPLLLLRQMLSALNAFKVIITCLCFDTLKIETPPPTCRLLLGRLATRFHRSPHCQHPDPATEAPLFHFPWNQLRCYERVWHSHCTITWPRST
ncbi:hypothetical protein GWK47_041496 [Chionoecetes opilio]|nr:hypothetical protein GWK47_041496 [Chionoecetes opilio]